jgi:3,4-dihydroxy 2-butanone 4-phosphate synthase/GTP cyclohydrolase II
MSKKYIHQAVEAFKQGQMIIVTDDEDRENEGDIVVAADYVTQEQLTFMAKKASGLICIALDSSIARRLALNPMVEKNEECLKTAFTVSVDARFGITTGISSHDRLVTVKTIVDPSSSPYDLVRPGHMFPVVARTLHERRGHTEASVALAHYCGLTPASIICEIMGENGEMLYGNNLEIWAEKYKIHKISVQDIVDYVVL